MGSEGVDWIHLAQGLHISQRLCSKELEKCIAAYIVLYNERHAHILRRDTT
jgi:hypothetical protein